MESFIVAEGLSVKLDNGHGVIVLPNEKAIYTWRDKRRVNVRRAGTSIYVGAWVQWIFSLIGFDDVNVSPTYDKFWKGDGVRDVLVIVPSNYGGCDEAPVY